MNNYTNNDFIVGQFRQPTTDGYLELAKILEAQNGRPYSLEETKETGDSLMRFYTLLANGRKIIVPKSIKGNKEPNLINRDNLTKNKTD